MQHTCSHTHSSMCGRREGATGLLCADVSKGNAHNVGSSPSRSSFAGKLYNVLCRLLFFDLK